MIDRIYLFLGSGLLAWTAASAFLGHEYRSAVRPLPIPGQVVESARGYSSSSRSHSSGSSSTRSGGGVFGGK
ncbi:MAG: hypothetical protein K2W96_28300 [Gemmataceae bacterium]|nr:hypothetical protein [Gemmataceae bacterium]